MKLEITYDTAVKLAQYLSKGKTTEMFKCELYTMVSTNLEIEQVCQIIVKEGETNGR